MTRPRPGGHHSELVLGGQPQPPPSTLAGVVFEHMGSECDKVGVPPSLGADQGSSVFSSSLVSSPPGSFGPGSLGRGGYITSQEASDRGSDLPLNPRVLRTHFCSAENLGGLETCAGFVQPKHLPYQFAVPYGNAQFDQGFNPQGGLGCLYRPSGCLFSYSNFTAQILCSYIICSYAAQ